MPRLFAIALLALTLIGGSVMVPTMILHAALAEGSGDGGGR